MTVLFELDDEYRKWYDSRPPLIQRMVLATPPNLLYRNKLTGQLMTMHAYHENGTVRADAPILLNPRQLYGRSVFGINPNDLERREDIPAAGPVATADEVSAYIKAYWATQPKPEGLSVADMAEAIEKKLNG